MPKKGYILAFSLLFLFCLNGPVTASDDYPVLKRIDQFFGKVMSGTSERILQGPRDLVITDLGETQGINVGDMFSIYEKNEFIGKDDEGRLFFEKIGELRIVKIFDKTSVATITRSKKELYMDQGRIFYLDPLRKAPPETPPSPAPVAAVTEKRLPLFTNQLR